MKVYGIGSILVYQPFIGAPRTVKVLDKEDDIKNGRPGFDAVEISEEGKEMANKFVWGYDDQIIRVVK